jgi:hypothetical protein
LLTAAKTDADLRLAAQLDQATPGRPAAAPVPPAARVTAAVVLAWLAIRAIRDVFSPPDRRGL